MNDFIDAIKNDSEEDEVEGSDFDASHERYNKLKREEADVDKRSPAERRYKELKDKAKEEMMKKQHENDEEPNEEDEAGFITH